MLDSNSPCTRWTERASWLRRGLLIKNNWGEKRRNNTLCGEEEKDYWARDTMFNILVAWELFSHSKIWRFWGAESMATLGSWGVWCGSWTHEPLCSCLNSVPGSTDAVHNTHYQLLVMVKSLEPDCELKRTHWDSDGLKSFVLTMYHELLDHWFSLNF